MYRTREERKVMQNLKGNCSRDTWFRSHGTLTVPATPNGILASLVRGNLERSRKPAGTVTKIVEWWDKFLF